jgi:hypothetical protein
MCKEEIFNKDDSTRECAFNAPWSAAFWVYIIALAAFGYAWVGCNVSGAVCDRDCLLFPYGTPMANETKSERLYSMPIVPAGM